MTGAPLASALAGRYSETNEPVFMTGVQALVRLPLDQLHPPVLRAIGLERKIALGPWFEPGFRGLQAMRRLRRTRWDPFGYAHVRKLERELIVEYRAMSTSCWPGSQLPTTSRRSRSRGCPTWFAVTSRSS